MDLMPLQFYLPDQFKMFIKKFIKFINLNYKSWLNSFGGFCDIVVQYQVSLS